MVENIKKLADLITKQQKFIEDNFKEYEDRVSYKDLDQKKDFYNYYEGEINWWEQKVTSVLNNFNKQNYLIRFTKPNNIKLSKHIYFTEDLDNKVEAQLKILTEILVEEEKNGIVQKKDDQNGYFIKYTMGGEILLNGLSLHQCQAGSLPDKLFNYLVNHSNTIIKLSEIEAIEGEIGLTSDIHQTLRDLGFKNNLKKIFFPATGIKTIQFINPVSEDYLTENHLPHINLSKLM